MNLLPLTAMPAPTLTDLTAAGVGVLSVNATATVAAEAIDPALAEELLLVEALVALLASLESDALHAASAQSNAHQAPPSNCVLIVASAFNYQLPGRSFNLDAPRIHLPAAA